MRWGEYPRVLIVGAGPMNRESGTGITLSNLFGRWPKDRLAQVYIQAEEPDSSICARTFRLDGRCAACDFYLRKLVGKRGLSYAPPTPGLAGMRQGSWCRPGALLHSVARAVNDMSPVVLPGALSKWVRKFGADMIYSLLGSIRVMSMTLKVSMLSGRGIIPHFMDDWSMTMYSDGVLCGLPRMVLYRKLRQIFQRSPLGLCIGERMAEEYRQRYGLQFRSFMNCVDNGWFVKPESRKYERIVVSYIGGLHLNRWKVLVIIASAVVELGCEMRIFVPHSDLERYGLEFQSVRGVHLGSLASDEVLDELKRSDIAVHVESFDSFTTTYTRYSVSTKIPQYMAAGKAILACGPDNLASMEVIRSANAGVVIGNDDAEIVREGVSRLIGDEAVRMRLARNGYEYAREHFAEESVQRRFQTIMAEAAWGNGVGRERHA